MKKYLILFAFSCLVLFGSTQEKVATIDPGTRFSSGSHSAGYYDKYRGQFRINLQGNGYLARLVYDSGFNLIDSFSYKPNDISFNYDLRKKLYFLTAIVLADDSYEVFANEDKVILVKTDFKGRSDRRIYEHTIKQTEEDDERLLAVFPWRTQIKILSVSIDKSKLFVYSWQPDGTVSKTDFDLPESNITDAKQKKEIPKIARVKFGESLYHPAVKSAKETVLLDQPNTTIYYSDQLIHILVPTPYNLGVYVMELDLARNTFKGENYFVNTLKDNASENLNYHKIARSLLYDSLLIIKNASDRLLEYYFYNASTGKLLKKYSASPGELKDLIHSDMKQKGSWLAANDEKDIDSYSGFLRKGKAAMIYISSASPDSFTITQLMLARTAGIEGALLGMVLQTPLALSGIPYYATALIPSPGIYRNKIIYAHSRFSTKDLSLSKSSTVTTALDKIFDEKNADVISKNSSFAISWQGVYYFGCYSGDPKKIEVFKYYGDH